MILINQLVVSNYYGGDNVKRGVLIWSIAVVAITLISGCVEESETTGGVKKPSRKSLDAEVINNNGMITIRNKNTYEWHNCTFIAEDYYEGYLGDMPPDEKRELIAIQLVTPKGDMMMRKFFKTGEIKCTEGSYKGSFDYI